MMDPAALARIHAASFTHPRPWTEAEFTALLDSAGVFLLTADNGFLLGRAIAGEAELLTLAVDPAARRRGLGSRLVAEFKAEAAARNADTAFLDVAEGNAPAIALYASHGFAETGRRRGYYVLPDGPKQDAILMTCGLDPDTADI